MSADDAAVVLRAADRFQDFWTEGTRELGEASKNAPRPLPPQVLDLYRVWNERSEEAIEAAKRSFEREISAEGQTKLQAYLLDLVKRNMSVHLSDAEAGAPARSTPPSAAPPRQLPDLTGMADAAKALAVLRVIDRDQDATIELWNGSPKAIAAYMVAICAPQMFQRQGLDTFDTPNPGIATGAVDELNVSKKGRPRCDPMTPSSVAVIFVDGTSAGARSEIERMKFTRLARMAETERIHRILAAAGSELPDWKELRQEIGELPEGEDAALQSVLGVRLSGVDTEELKSANESTRFALFSGVTQIRSTILNDIGRPAEVRLPSLGLPQWTFLREEYGTLTETYQAFRQRSVGSLYR